jgi:hypothetical protein
VSSFDNSASTGTLLANLQWNETDPQYRQIKLEHSADWVRIRFRRPVVRFTDRLDWIPLPSSVAVILMLRALKAYDEDDLARGTGFEATARRLLTEATRAAQPPTHQPIQVHDRHNIHDKRDSID